MTGRAVVTTRLSSDAMKRASPVMSTAHAPRWRSTTRTGVGSMVSKSFGRVSVVVIGSPCPCSPAENVLMEDLLVVSGHYLEKRKKIMGSSRCLRARGVHRLEMFHPGTYRLGPGFVDRQQVNGGHDRDQHAVGEEILDHLFIQSEPVLDEMPEHFEGPSTRGGDFGITGGGRVAVHLDLEQLAVLHQLQIGYAHRVLGLFPFSAFHRTSQFIDDSGGAQFIGGDEQVLLRTEKTKEVRLRDAGARSDGVGRGAGVARLGELCDRSAENGGSALSSCLSGRNHHVEIVSGHSLPCQANSWKLAIAVDSAEFWLGLGPQRLSPVNEIPGLVNDLEPGVLENPLTGQVVENRLGEKRRGTAASDLAHRKDCFGRHALTLRRLADAVADLDLAQFIWRSHESNAADAHAARILDDHIETPRHCFTREGPVAGESRVRDIEVTECRIVGIPHVTGSLAGHDVPCLTLRQSTI